MDFSWIFEGNTLDLLLMALGRTIFYTLTGFVISSIIGLLVALGQISRSSITTWLAEAYISWFRSTPLLVQLVLVYYGLPVLLGINTIAWVCGIIALGMYSGAYMSQIIRGAIISIDKGQMEAGRSLGYSYWAVMRKIIVPQAIRRMIAPATNEFISLTKNSSLLSTITVIELFREANTIIATNFRTIEVYLVVAILYYLTNNIIGMAGALLEKRLKTGDELK
ncbi:amino acid ABC transporter permease [Dialister hominis]|uniref:amino acid ABC transporter permease n=2 Tax=Dialister TaxID=39948 RepID=UPI003AB3D73F